MLEVVEEQEQLPPTEEAREVVGSPDRLRDLGGNEPGVGEAAEGNPEHAVAEPAHELGRDLEREACLPGAARAGDREQPRPVRERRDELVELALPPDERARGDGQVRCVERPERWEDALAELVEPLGLDEVLQPMLAEIVELVVVDEPPRRL
jgi:hypothetical protein